MSSLRTLQICASHGNQLGGMEKQVIAICDGLIGTDHEVHIAASPQLLEQISKEAVLHALPTEKSRRHPALKNTLLSVIEHVKPDIIHAHGLKAAALLQALPRYKDCKRVVSIHGDKKDLRVLKGMDACIGVSKEIYTHLQEEGFPAVLIENGIPPYRGPLISKEQLCTELNLDASLPLLLCAGRLAPVKRYHLAMRACRDLPVNLVIAGDGPMFKELKQLTTERILLIGNRNDAPGLLAAADAVLSISEREGMSLTMLEALAASTPVLSTPVSGAASLLPKQSLIPSKTPDDLRQFLSNASNVLDQHRKAQSSLFEAIRNEFTQEAMVSRTCTLYRQLVRRSELLFLGDCNTCGTEQLKGQAYPALVGEALNRRIQNCGQTMATTREALKYFAHFGHDHLNAVFIQYGLVDSWSTLKAAPYVLYYPDNARRRFFRRWVKKWKKYGRKIGIGKLFGMTNQVPIEEYQANIAKILDAVSCPVFLIETAPNQDDSRNPAIQAYNAALAELAEQYAHASLIHCYEVFATNMQDYYQDATHFSPAGHAKLAEMISKHPLLSAP
ncbi:hypothetical protein A3758_11390 [Oleiphilus sp. HI0118]|nr:hypothetical protein A3758_11390 [Oleiphilus sp. HI0118]